MAWTTNTIILSLKLLLIFAGAFSIASGLRFSVQLLIHFSISQAPSLWSSLRSWLRPPYLYVIINGIIISIVASSWFRRRNDDVAEDPPRMTAEPSPAFQYPTASEFGVGVKYARKWTEPAVEAEEEKNVVAGYGGREANFSNEEDKHVISEEENEFGATVPSSIGYTPEIPSPATNHPLVSPRFAYRKLVNSSPQAGRRSLRVAKPKQQQHDTMEDTWKMIMAGREVVLARETENHGGEMVVCDGLPALKKSETFKDRTNYYNQSGPPVTAASRLRKEPSLGEEELNHRAEAFIKKFNEEMKRQRQESLNQYMDVINRGTN